MACLPIQNFDCLCVILKWGAEQWRNNGDMPNQILQMYNNTSALICTGSTILPHFTHLAALYVSPRQGTEGCQYVQTNFLGYFYAALRKITQRLRGD